MTITFIQFFHIVLFFIHIYNPYYRNSPKTCKSKCFFTYLYFDWFFVQQVFAINKIFSTLIEKYYLYLYFTENASWYKSNWHSYFYSSSSSALFLNSLTFVTLPFLNTKPNPLPISSLISLVCLFALSVN